MSTTSTSATLFPPELVTEMFSKVKGHSTLAKLCGASPMPFAGIEQFTFAMDGEASIVGEGMEKPPGKAKFGTKTIVPIKFIYQHRVTDEFTKLSDEKRVPYLKALADGFAVKISRALDIASIHGVNPADGVPSALVGDNCMAKAVKASVVYDETTPDDNIDDAVKPIHDKDGIVTGIGMSTAFGSALGKMKTADSHIPMYPEFRFGANPAAFGGMKSDVNNTISFGDSDIRAIIGDFANAFKWGYAENIPLEVIEFGDPDGLGDLKRKNQVCLRTEAYIGWGILDPDSFALIKAASA